MSTFKMLKGLLLALALLVWSRAVKRGLVVEVVIVPIGNKQDGQDGQDPLSWINDAKAVLDENARLLHIRDDRQDAKAPKGTTDKRFTPSKSVVKPDGSIEWVDWE